MADHEAAGALAGLRVLELGGGVAASFCGKLLADYGAEVIKVESPLVGDPVRAIGPFAGDDPHPEKSGLFFHLNTNKLSMTLNLRSDSGLALLHRLLPSTDVVVESFAPAELQQMQLDYDHLRAINHRVIVAALTSFGQTGPYRDYRLSDMAAQAIGGNMYLLGEPDREPLHLPGFQAEQQAGFYATLSTLAALVERDDSGEGQQIDAAIGESFLPLLQNVPQNYFFFGDLLKRDGNRLLTRPQDTSGPYPSTTLPCQDGYIHVHGARPHDGKDGLEQLADLVGEPRLKAPELRSAPRGHADEIDALLLPWLMQHPRLESLTQAQATRIPFGAVLTTKEVLDDPHHRARNFFEAVDHPVLGLTPHIGPPFRMSETPSRRGRPPLLGEHNQLVYRDLLGYGAGELAQLREAGII